MNTYHRHPIQGTGLHVLSCNCDMPNASEPTFILDPVLIWVKRIIVLSIFVSLVIAAILSTRL